MTRADPDPTVTADRLVCSPVFILSPMRAGSTLLRVLLDSHSEVRAPHEMHLRTLGVTYAETYTELAVDRLRLNQRELEHLLWDRLLHWALTRSGKRLIVDKTPGNALVWRRIAECWPAARYIFLLRHPGSILASLAETSGMAPEPLVPVVLQYVDEVEAARQALSGHTVTYEDLVADPARTLRRVCAFLDVDWEPAMLNYGEFDHGTFEMFLGDFTENIRSGSVRPARRQPDPETVPAALHAACRRWGY
ncbi:MAG TPA: sulfotransferase [Pseudonocardiaceae bacterium]|nr:sulfotransferase [Pseudonocardiaceae bacterium]